MKIILFCACLAQNLVQSNSNIRFVLIKVSFFSNEISKPRTNDQEYVQDLFSDLFTAAKRYDGGAGNSRL
jgi:hypothetical protein